MTLDFYVYSSRAFFQDNKKIFVLFQTIFFRNANFIHIRSLRERVTNILTFKFLNISKKSDLYRVIWNSSSWVTSNAIYQQYVVLYNSFSKKTLSFSFSPQMLFYVETLCRFQEGTQRMLIGVIKLSKRKE